MRLLLDMEPSPSLYLFVLAFLAIILCFIFLVIRQFLKNKHLKNQVSDLIAKKKKDGLRSNRIKAKINGWFSEM